MNEQDKKPMIRELLERLNSAEETYEEIRPEPNCIGAKENRLVEAVIAAMHKKKGCKGG